MTRIVIFGVLIVGMGVVSGCGRSQPTIVGEPMNEEVCTDQDGVWGMKEDLFDDGSFDVYFACTCPKTKSDETQVIFMGSAESCK